MHNVEIIFNDGIPVCAYPSCQCEVSSGEEYCCTECGLMQDEMNTCACSHATCDANEKAPLAS